MILILHESQLVSDLKLSNTEGFAPTHIAKSAYFRKCSWREESNLYLVFQYTLQMLIYIEIRRLRKLLEVFYFIVVFIIPVSTISTGVHWGIIILEHSLYRWVELVGQNTDIQNNKWSRTTM